MAFEIKASQIQDVAVFKKAIQDHITNMTAFNKTVGKPRPVAHPLVEACIKRVQTRGKPDQYIEDWVVFDDLPPEPEPILLTLEEKKQKLHNALLLAENAAKTKILPLRKHRLLQTKYLIAVNKPEDQRSPEEADDAVAYNSLVAAYRQLELISARAESDIEDLTEDTIDSWQPPTFG